MEKIKITRLPFLLIVSFSLLVMAAILVTQYQGQKSIKLLKSENLQSFRTLQINNILADIINQVYIIDEMGKTYVSSANNEQYQNLLDTAQQLQNGLFKIKQLIDTTKSNTVNIQKLSSLLNRKIEPLQSLQNTSSKTEKDTILSNFISKSGIILTDSIYSTALDVQLNLEEDLKNTIQQNEVLTGRIFSSTWILGFISILAVAILASIIIKRLFYNYKLIQALHNANLEVEKQSQVKEQFLANMSHEIRTPINSVIGFTNMLRKTELKGNQEQFVGLINTAGQNLLNIVNDILDISKIEAGMLHFDKNPFHIKELCYTMEKMYFHQVADKKLSYQWNIAPDVPSVLIGDKERLAQILNNLINNAIKFTKEGGITLTIDLVKSQEKTVNLRFSVSDTGIGILPDKLESIFKRFEQAEADTTRNYGGTGLGLSIVKSLVELQGGSITAKSETGKGSEFIFEIVLGVDREDLLTSVKSTYTQNTVTVNKNVMMQNIRILAAEDNIMNQMLLKYILEQWQIQYVFVETGKAAVEKLRNNKFDLVLMDIQMPEMDGYTATQIIRNELNLNIPIIAMTANVLPGEKGKCKEIGMNDYISKPLNESILFDTIAQYVQIKNASQPGNQAHGSIIDLSFLNTIFANNKEFIKGIIQEFNIQYPLELLELQNAVNNRDINKVRAKSHYMKTTLSTVNNKKTLLQHLDVMENADDTSSSWEIIEHKMQILAKSINDLPTDIKEITD